MQVLLYLVLLSLLVQSVHSARPWKQLLQPSLFFKSKSNINIKTNPNVGSRLIIPDLSNSTMSSFSENPCILLTGGAGYIGSHTALCLLQAGYNVTVIDNLVNSNEESLRRVKELAGVDSDRLKFFKVDLCDRAALEEIFKNSPRFASCIHFAGLKAVGESVAKPLLYYENNLGSTFNLLAVMEKYGCKSIVFSSSATVYGSAAVPITETSQVGVGITNAYGRTKYMIEEILQDFKRSKDLAGDKWSVVILRYFNPVGSHPSGRIGEDPNGIPNNLMPFVSQVAVGRRAKLSVFGNDYDTKDGTGVRDYIHVMDLAEGHVAAIKFVEDPQEKAQIPSTNPIYESYNDGNGRGELSIFNLGAGIGYSVLEMIAAMEKASGRHIAYDIAPRREGDIATCYADCSKAERLLKWKTSRTLDDMCRDLWCWQSNNPSGYN